MAAGSNGFKSRQAVVSETLLVDAFPGVGVPDQWPVETRLSCPVEHHVEAFVKAGRGQGQPWAGTTLCLHLIMLSVRMKFLGWSVSSRSSPTALEMGSLRLGVCGFCALSV